jgi:hypothetical protein
VRQILSVLVAMVMLAGCGGAANTPTATPPSPETLLQQAITNIREAESFAMSVEQGGAPFPFIFQLGAEDDPFRTVMQRANAHFVAPDQLHASARMRVEGAPPISLQLYVDGFTQWLKPPLFRWTQYEYAPGFNPRLLMGEDSGFNSALSRLTRIDFLGLEDRFGEMVYHVRGEASGQVVNDLLFGLLIINEETAIVDVFINRETRFPSVLLLTLPGTATAEREDTFWRIELFDVNQPQEFETPPPPVRATAEATAEATSEAMPEATPEATSEATSETTPETTADANEDA